MCDHALNIGNKGQITYGCGRFSTVTPQLLGADVYAVRGRGQGDARTKLSERPGTSEPDPNLASTTGNDGDVAAEVARAMVRQLVPSRTSEVWYDRTNLSFSLSTTTSIPADH
jgi:hypothetical protein